MQEFLGPEIISHLVMHGASVTDIIKYMINEIKKKDDDLPKMFLEALKKVETIFFLGSELLMSHYDYTFFMAAECLKHPYRCFAFVSHCLRFFAWEALMCVCEI